MPKIYKVNRVSMSPQNETIDPTISNSFQFTFQGEFLRTYTIRFYNLFTGAKIKELIVTPLGDRSNGASISKSILASDWAGLDVTKLRLSYDIQCFGGSSTMSTTLNVKTVYIPLANYGFAEHVYIASTTLFSGIQDLYLIPIGSDGYYVYSTVEAARNGFAADRMNPTATTTYVVSPVSTSEQVPFLASQTPTFTLASVIATSGTYVVTPTYYQADGQALNKFSVFLYDSSENLLFASNEIYSSNPTYTFTNLAHGESYKVQFQGWNVVDQFVDTGKIVLTVTYSPPIPSKTYAVSVVDDCVNGRANLTIAATPLQFLLSPDFLGPYDTFNVTNILVYRQEYGATNSVIIASLPPQTTLYHDYMAQSGKSYRYWIGFYGNDSGGLYWSGYFVVNNTPVTAYTPITYYGWFLIDLDNDKSYAFDVQFEGGDTVQEDDFTKYKSNTRYNSYSVGNLKSFSSNNSGLISVGNLHGNFSATNSLLDEISNLVSPSNTGRKIVKDRRNPTRIFPVFTYGFKQIPLHNGVSSQPYICSFSWDQINDLIE